MRPLVLWGVPAVVLSARRSLGANEIPRTSAVRLLGRCIAPPLIRPGSPRVPPAFYTAISLDTLSWPFKTIENAGFHKPAKPAFSHAFGSLTPPDSRRMIAAPRIKAGVRSPMTTRARTYPTDREAKRLALLDAVDEVRDAAIAGADEAERIGKLPASVVEALDASGLFVLPTSFWPAIRFI